MDKKIEAAIRETLVIGNPVSIKRCVDKLKLIFEQEQALRQANVKCQLPLIEKAIDDTFNQVHYSFLHPDVVQPIEHNSWRETWIKTNCGNCT